MARRSKKSPLYRIARVNERFWGRRGEVKNRDILDENGAFLRQSAGFCPVCRGFWGDGGRRKAGREYAPRCKKRYFRTTKAYRVRSFGNTHLVCQKRNITFALRTPALTDAGLRCRVREDRSFISIHGDRPRSTPVCTRAAAASGMARRLRRNLPPTRTS